MPVGVDYIWERRLRTPPEAETRVYSVAYGANSSGSATYIESGDHAVPDDITDGVLAGVLLLRLFGDGRDQFPCLRGADATAPRSAPRRRFYARGRAVALTFTSGLQVVLSVGSVLWKLSANGVSLAACQLYLRAGVIVVRGDFVQCRHFLAAEDGVT